MKAIAGFLQEVQASGSVTWSWVRKLSAMFFVLLVAYTATSLWMYIYQFNYYTWLLAKHLITEQTFVVLIQQLERINWDIFLILVLATVAPKVIQKFAEVKTGSGSSLKTTTSTTETSEESKT
jgi:hypothetical protein